MALSRASYDIDTLQLVSAALNVMGYSANTDALSQNQMELGQNHSRLFVFIQ